MFRHEEQVSRQWVIKYSLVVIAIVFVFIGTFLTLAARDYARALQYRDAAWEEAVRFIALRMNENHPMLSERQTLVYTRDHFIDPGYFSDFLQPDDADTRSFFDPEVRAEFDRRIEHLITRIPDLNEREILFGIREAAAVLGDANTNINISRGLFFPFDIVYIDGSFYVYRIIAGYEHLLYTKLVAINGIAIDEVMTRLAAIIPHENEYMLRSYAQNNLHTRALLSYMNVYDGGISFLEQFSSFMSGRWSDEIPSTFSFEDEMGTVHSINLVSRSTLRGGSVVRESISYRDTTEMLKYLNPMSNYWFEYFPENNMIYVRLRLISEMTAMPYAEFGRMIADEIDGILQDKGVIDRFVVDLRGSRGTWPPPLYTAAEFLNNTNINNFFILIDHDTRAGGVVSAALLRDLVDGAKLMGEPTGHSPNFFANPISFRIPYNLPGNRAGFTVSTTYWNLAEDDERTALIPDIYVPRSLEAHMNNRDSVMEMVLGM